MYQRRVFGADYIIRLLAQIESAQTRGRSVDAACNDAEISVATYYRWRRQYGEHGSTQDLTAAHEV